MSFAENIHSLVISAERRREALKPFVAEARAIDECLPQLRELSVLALQVSKSVTPETGEQKVIPRRRIGLTEGVLECMSDNREWTAVRISEKIDRPISSVNSALSTLAKEKRVTRLRMGVYKLPHPLSLVNDG